MSKISSSKSIQETLMTSETQNYDSFYSLKD